MLVPKNACAQKLNVYNAALKMAPVSILSDCHILTMGVCRDLLSLLMKFIFLGTNY